MRELKLLKYNKRRTELTRKIFVSVLILFFLCLVFGTLEAKNSVKNVPIKVIFDDDTVIEGINLVLIEGMGFLSTDDVSKIFNTTTSWHSVSKKVSVTLGVDTIEFFVDSEKVIINGKAKKMGKNTKFIEGTIMVPLEFFLTKSFGDIILSKVNWEYNEKILRISQEYNILSIRPYTHAKYTRIVLDTKAELKYTVVKGYPDKLLVTVYHGVLKNRSDSFKVNDGRVKNITLEQDRRATRLTIHLDKLAEDYKDFQLENPCRIVVDIKGGEVKVADKKPSVSTKKVASDKGTKIPKVTKKISTSKTASSEFKIKTIVIDAGHGGKDPGAIGRRGTKEKDIVLDIAKRLARMLREKSDVNVVLTRKGDYFLTLDERTRIANANNADLFVSIHTNASISRKFRGFEIYFLSDKASDKEAEAVAKIENSVINLESNRKKDNLSMILWSMSLNEFMNESSEVCSLIAKEVPKTTGIKNRGVRQAGFYVLRDARMPAILVEVAFISNSEEENKLRTRSFREKMAEAIFDGIMKYKRSIEKKG